MTATLVANSTFRRCVASLGAWRCARPSLHADRHVTTTGQWFDTDHLVPPGDRRCAATIRLPDGDGVRLCARERDHGGHHWTSTLIWEGTDGDYESVVEAEPVTVQETAAPIEGEAPDRVTFANRLATRRSPFQVALAIVDACALFGTEPEWDEVDLNRLYDVLRPLIAGVLPDPGDTATLSTWRVIAEQRS